MDDLDLFCGNPVNYYRYQILVHIFRLNNQFIYDLYQSSSNYQDVFYMIYKNHIAPIKRSKLGNMTRHLPNHAGHYINEEYYDDGTAEKIQNYVQVDKTGTRLLTLIDLATIRYKIRDLSIRRLSAIRDKLHPRYGLVILEDFDVKDSTTADLALFTLECYFIIYLMNRSSNMTETKFRNVMKAFHDSNKYKMYQADDWIRKMGSLGYTLLDHPSKFVYDTSSKMFICAFSKGSLTKAITMPKLDHQIPSRLSEPTDMNKAFTISKVLGQLSTTRADSYAEIMYMIYKQRRSSLYNPGRLSYAQNNHYVYRYNLLEEYIPDTARVYVDYGAGDYELSARIAYKVKAEEIYAINIISHHKVKYPRNLPIKMLDRYDVLDINHADLVTAIYSLHHMRDPRSIIQKIYQMLPSHGRFIVQDHNIDEYDCKQAVILEHICYGVAEMTNILDYQDFYDYLQAFRYDDENYYEYHTFQYWDQMIQGEGFQLADYIQRNRFTQSYIAIYDKI